MDYRPLGRTGAKVSPLCLGTMLFGDDTGEAESYAIVDRAIDAGINFIDTANVYGRGTSERVLGDALQRNGKRDRVVLATKAFGRMDDDDPNAARSHRRHLIEQCEASLQRLGTDWIDLYQIHRPTSEIPIDETLRALDDLIKSGKVRYVGTSTFGAWQVMESLWVSKELGLNRFVTEQPPYHLLDRRIERELIPMAQTYGIGLLPWSPLAGGFLTGRYQRDGEVAPASRFGQRSEEQRRRHFREETFQVVDRVQELATEKRCTPTQLSLAWCAQQPGITSPVIGPRTRDHLEENLGALEVEITDADRERLNEVSPPGRALVPYYEADFGPHQHRW
ncbi:MAG: aldo/keto reductase [Candidatus Bipolaricaulia bacterium]